MNMFNKNVVVFMTLVLISGCSVINIQRSNNHVIDLEDCNYKKVKFRKSYCGSCHTLFNNVTSAGNFTLHDLDNYNTDSLDYLFDKAIEIQDHNWIKKSYIDTAIFFDKYCSD